MNEVTIFENEKFGEVRAVKDVNEVWFVAADVCRVLELGNPTRTVERLDDDEKGLTTIKTLGGEQQMLVVNEAGLYSLVLTSRKPQAKEFKRWVTHDVLPSIRKHGLYAMDEVLANPDVLINALIELKKEREAKKALANENARKSQQIAEMTPKATYYDIVLNCKDLVTITTIAKDYGMSARKLNKILGEKKVQYKLGNSWYLYQHHAEMGYTQSKTYTYGNDEKHATMHTLWTQKGRLFIYDLLKHEGILPVMERE